MKALEYGGRRITRHKDGTFSFPRNHCAQSARATLEETKREIDEINRKLNECAEVFSEQHRLAVECERLAEANGKQCIQAAIVAGRALNEAHDRIDFGMWIKWQKDNCPGVSEDTLLRYRKLAQAADSAHVRGSDLFENCFTLRQAYVAAGIIKIKAKSTAEPKAKGPVDELQRDDPTEMDQGKEYTERESEEVDKVFERLQKDVQEARSNLSVVAAVRLDESLKLLQPLVDDFNELMKIKKQKESQKFEEFFDIGAAA